MSLIAGRCENGHCTFPVHPRCPDCLSTAIEEVDLSDREGTIITWTVSTATPPGVRQPNPLAIVEFEVGDDQVRAIGQLTESSVQTGDRVVPEYVEELRTPGEGIREPNSQSWDGYRFRPLEHSD